MWKKRCACTQHGVPTDYLPDMDGLNVPYGQPRLQVRGMKGKFVAEHRQHMEEQLEDVGDYIKAPHYPIIQHGLSQRERIRKPFYEVPNARTSEPCASSCHLVGE
jgi:hypothetical protein